MFQTKKRRQGPTESATLFGEGTTKKGNDGNMWTILVTDAGVHRWSRTGTTGTGTGTGKPHTPTSTPTPNPTSRNKTVKNTKPRTPPPPSTNITREELVKMANHHQVTTSGSKKELAEKIWRVRSNALPAKDLTKIVHLLSEESQKEVNKIIKEQTEYPITNYRGMWYPQPKPLDEMPREELLKRIRKFRDAFEKITTRNQDLDDDRLAGETDKELRVHLKYYFSEGARIQSASWLRDYKP
jgi:hypothetical protein